MEKTALVTGGNKGIGLEVVRQLAQRGFRVALAARDEARGTKAVDQLRKSGLDVTFLKMDVSDDASVARAAKEFGKTFDALDVLINNAAILLDKIDNIGKTPIDFFGETFETNVAGPVRVIQAFLPYLKKARGARMINVSSGAGSLQEMNTYAPAYSVSKAALNAVTKQFAAALRDQKISVNSVCPGWVRTDMGGSNAPRSVEEGAAGIVWMAVDAPATLTGDFRRDKQPAAW